jgi:hypothetical protein
VGLFQKDGLSFFQMAGFEMQLDVVKILAIMQPLFQNPRETL